MFKRIRKWLSKLSATRSRMLVANTQTEFTAEIVRITTVAPHPGADRLDLLGFELASGPTSYQVVGGKGNFAVGDLAAYFSVDCILPTKHEAFAFLASEGKTHHRLRAARLRGVFSQGLLVPAPKGAKLGQQVAEIYGVMYHSPDVAEPAPGTQATKKKKAQVLPVYGVDSLKKTPHLFAEGEPVVVTEKIHGTNFRFGWVRKKLLGIPYGWEFVVGSHRTIRGTVGKECWYGEDLYMQAAVKMDLARKTSKYKGYVFFGELYGYTYTGARIQDLVYGRKPEDGPGLVIFDIKGPKGWLSYDDRVYDAKCAGLQTVPEIAWPSWDSGVVRHADGSSAFDGKQIREGIVVEAMNPYRKAKYVSQAYLLRKGA